MFRVRPPIDSREKAIVLGGSSSGSRMLLGRLAELGPQREVWLDLDSEHVIAVVGKRGSGKTHTLGVIVEGIGSSIAGAVHRNAATDRPHAVVVFDTLNLFQWINVPLAAAQGPHAARQRELAKKWGLDPQPIEPTLWHPIGSEPAAAASQPFSINPGDMDSQDWGRLLGVDTVADPMGQLLADVLSKLRPRDPAGAKARYSIADMLDVVRVDKQIAADFAPETIRAVRQRLVSLSRTPLFDANQPDWTKALVPGKVAVFLLGRVPEDLRTLLVFLVMRRLLEARSAASETSKHNAITGAAKAASLVPPTWVVIDEAQNIMPTRNLGPTNDILTRFVREGRNFGLSLALTTQQPGSIDARVMAQVDTLVVHNLTVRSDVNYSVSNLKSADAGGIQNGGKEISLSDSIRLLAPGECMISTTDAARVLFCEVRPRLTLHGGFEA